MIDGGLALRCVYLADRAVLAGFTLRRGSAPNGAGAWCASTNVAVSNCVLTGNSAIQGGGVSLLGPVSPE